MHHPHFKHTFKFLKRGQPGLDELCRHLPPERADVVDRGQPSTVDLFSADDEFVFGSDDLNQPV